MRKRILTMTVAAMTVIAAMTGCNKKDAGSVETAKQNTVTDVETTTAAKTTTEVETTTEAETTTEYSYENDPYFDMENALGNEGHRYCLIDGDTYMAITGAECIAENMPIAEEYTNVGHSAYSAIRYYGHNNGMGMSFDELHGSDGFKPTLIKRIYTVPENPYVEREYKNEPVIWFYKNTCVQFLCEFDNINGESMWDVMTADEIKYHYGIDINEYIDYDAYRKSIIGTTTATE